MFAPTRAGSNFRGRSFPWHDVRRGFSSVLPLWPGTIPFGIAFAILARTSGFTSIETQAMSMLVFAGAAQLTIVSLVGGGSGVLAVILTVLLLNLRHILYALSLQPRLHPDERPRRPLVAFFLVDETYGVTMREYLAGRGSAALLFGAGISLYLCFSLATLVGIVFGSFLPDPERLGLAFVFPLAFLALLLPLLRSRNAVAVAIVAGTAILLLRDTVNAGIAFLIAVVLAVGVGTLLDRTSTNNAGSRGYE